MNAIEDSRAKRSETDENLRGGHPKIHGWVGAKVFLRFKTFSMRKKTSSASPASREPYLRSSQHCHFFLDRKEGHVSLIKNLSRRT
jgi:hypothetical protein